MQAVFPGYTVDLCDRFIAHKDIDDLRKRVRVCLDLEIAGYCAADLLRIDHRRVFLDNAPALQRLYARFDGNAGDASLLPDLGLRHPRVCNQQADDLAVQLIKPIQKHALSPFTLFCRHYNPIVAESQANRKSYIDIMLFIFYNLFRLLICKFQ